MVITTTVQLEGDDAFAYTPDAAAAQVLAALGGNPTKDVAHVTVSMPASTGSAGSVPDIPPP